MKTWIRKSFAVGVVSSAMLLLTGTTAQAHNGVTTVGGAAGSGVLSGNVVQIPITVVAPIQICNNGVLAVALLSSGMCTQGNTGVVNHH